MDLPKPGMEDWEDSAVESTCEDYPMPPINAQVSTNRHPSIVDHPMDDVNPPASPPLTC